MDFFSFNINLNMNGMPMGNGPPPGGYQQVPMPIQRFKGNHFDLLVPSDCGSSENVTVEISNIGSFSQNSEKPIISPALQLSPPPTPMKCKDADFVRKLTREECQEALINYADKKCCAGTGPAKQMHVASANTYNAFSYVLTTFTEKRSLVLKYSQCSPGERLDTTAKGPIPDPSSMQCSPNVMFQNHTKFINLPHTDTLHPCNRCNAFGKLRCSGCSGIGKVRCNNCDGSGRTTRNNPDGTQVTITCGRCNGSTMITCVRCSGVGEMTCDRCRGSQWLKWYLQVKIDYITHTDEYLSEKTEMPDELIKTAQGEVLKQDEGDQIIEINDCSNDDINQNSKRLIEKTKQEFNDGNSSNNYERQIFQKHCLTLITCTECEATYQTKEFKFWVLGQSKEIYSPDYPGGGCCGCCCCCTIL